MGKVSINLDKIRPFSAELEEVGAHGDQRVGIARCEVEAPDEFLSPRFGCIHQRPFILRRAGCRIASCSLLQPISIRTIGVLQQIKELQAFPVTEGVVSRSDGARESNAGCLAPGGEQRPAQTLDALLGGRNLRSRLDGASSTIANCAKQLPKKSHIHGLLFLKLRRRARPPPFPDRHPGQVRAVEEKDLRMPTA